MKISKCILLATLAISAHVASANVSADCGKAAQTDRNANKAKQVQLAQNLTGQVPAAAASTATSTSNVAK